MLHFHVVLQVPFRFALLSAYLASPFFWARLVCFFDVNCQPIFTFEFGIAPLTDIDEFGVVEKLRPLVFQLHQIHQIPFGIHPAQGHIMI